MLAAEHDDATQALEALDAALGGPAPTPTRITLTLPPLPKGPLAPFTLAQAVAHLTPEQTIVVDEGVTTSLLMGPLLTRARPIDHLMATTGGAIGQGLPVAVGAAVACPDRKVVCIEGDGSAAYTMQSLWTMARENLDVTVVICANRSYAVLKIELARVGATLGAGPRAMSMLDLHHPEMNWARIAEGMGIEASRATTSEEFAAQYESALQFVIFVCIFLSSCSSPTRLPTDANRALEAYWQSLPSDPTLTHQILQVWPGIVVPEETTTPSAPNREVWCVETEITAAKEVSIVGETVTWIVIRNDEKADWNVAMLATMSSIWPYEACGKGP